MHARTKFCMTIAPLITSYCMCNGTQSQCQDSFFITCKNNVFWHFMKAPMLNPNERLLNTVTRVPVWLSSGKVHGGGGLPDNMETPLPTHLTCIYIVRVSNIVSTGTSTSKPDCAWACINTVSQYLSQLSPADYIQLEHQYYPSCHHRQCPIHFLCRIPHVLPNHCFHQIAGHLHQHKLLGRKKITLSNQNF